MSGPSLASMAEAVLSAIASGSMSSFELTAKMVAAVLDEPVVREAIELDGLLRTRSPFALVRAVVLAELLVGAVGHAWGAGESSSRSAATPGRRTL